MPCTDSETDRSPSEGVAETLLHETAGRGWLSVALQMTILTVQYFQPVLAEGMLPRGCQRHFKASRADSYTAPHTGSALAESGLIMSSSTSALQRRCE
jgi:hypothetical protein